MRCHDRREPTYRRNEQALVAGRERSPGDGRTQKARHQAGRDGTIRRCPLFVSGHLCDRERHRACGHDRVGQEARHPAPGFQAICGGGERDGGQRGHGALPAHNSHQK
jgi:hypothetical protein